MTAFLAFAMVSAALASGVAESEPLVAVAYASAAGATWVGVRNASDGRMAFCVRQASISFVKRGRVYGVTVNSSPHNCSDPKDSDFIEVPPGGVLALAIQGVRIQAGTLANLSASLVLQDDRVVSRKDHVTVAGLVGWTGVVSALAIEREQPGTVWVRNVSTKPTAISTMTSLSPAACAERSILLPPGAAVGFRGFQAKEAHHRVSVVTSANRCTSAVVDLRSGFIR